MKKRIIVLMLMIAVGVTSPVLAQQSDDLPVYCGALEETDCLILRQSQEQMNTVHSASFRFDMEMAVTGRQDVKPDVVIGIGLNGAYEGNWSDVMAGLNPAAMTAIMTNPAALQTFVEERLREYRHQLTVTLSVPDTVDEADELPESIVFNTILVDGIFFIDASTIQPQTGTNAPESASTQWVGFDVARTAALYARLVGLPEASEQASDVVEAAGLVQDFTEIRRLPDETAQDGTQLAVFETSFDLQSMLQSSDLQELFQASFQDDDPEVEAEARDLSRSVLNILAALAGGVEIRTTQRIALDSSYLKETEFIFRFEPSLSVNGLVDILLQAVGRLVGVNSVTYDLPDSDGFSVSVRTTLSYDNFNETQDIRAPENATILSFRDIVAILRDQAPAP